MFDILFPTLALAAVTIVYAINNPANHSTHYRWRSFFNWFPLGLNYAMLYMGRYNLTVAKNALSEQGAQVMSNADFGMIFGIGAFVYGFSFVINGPLTDKIGGKRSIIIGTTGSALANACMGIVLMLALDRGHSINVPGAFCILYAINMYFQSFGAVSIVKINAHWFHIKERGVFGALFGVLISLGLYFAFDWSAVIVKAVKPDGLGLSGLELFLRQLLGIQDGSVAQTWWVFFIPAAFLLFFAGLSTVLLRDKPSDAGLEDFDTGDASSGDMTARYDALTLYKRILLNPVIMTIAAIEFCSGVLRNGIMHWGVIYAKTIGIDKTDFVFSNWGKVLAIAGVCGGFAAGIVSDKFFQSRRGPAAVFLYVIMIAACGAMFAGLSTPSLFGPISFVLSLAVIGVHGILSGTASMDFGGRKGAGTAVGVIDGFVYLGTGLQSLCLGFLLPNSSSASGWQRWEFWPAFLLPFAIAGLLFSVKIWKAIPNAARKA